MRIVTAIKKTTKRQLFEKVEEIIILKNEEQSSKLKFWKNVKKGLGEFGTRQH
jgi:hypothetical protein